MVVYVFTYTSGYCYNSPFLISDSKSKDTSYDWLQAEMDNNARHFKGQTEGGKADEII